MEKLPFEIMDLVPEEATFTLSTMPNKTLTLKKWSLLVRSWAIKRFGGAKQLQTIFQHQAIDEIAELCFYMLKEKELFNNELDQFLESISSMQDQVNIVTAMLKAIGIGEPEMDAIHKQIEKDAKPTPAPKSKAPKTGAKSSTP